MSPKEYEKIHAKSIIIDLDGTLSIDDEVPYKDRLPNSALIATLKAYKDRGWRVVIYTSRAMRSYAGDLAKIKAHALPEILEWLEGHKVPYDEVIVGKAWCGKEGFYVDDRALRPSEFVNLSEDEIILLLQREKEFAKLKFNEKISQKTLNSQKNSSKKTLNSKSSKQGTKSLQTNSNKMNLKTSQNEFQANLAKNGSNSSKSTLNSRLSKQGTKSLQENSSKKTLNSKPSKSNTKEDKK